MYNNTKYLIVIMGPTAVGKSSLALDLAQKFDTEIISTDSRQVYRELNIGTAKPTEDDLQSVTHHFINHLSVSQQYSAARYEKEALEKIHEIFESKDIVVAAGGTGLYIRALCHGFDHIPPIPESVKREVDGLYALHGIEILQTELQQVDPGYWEVVDRNNSRRLSRALCVYRHTGRPFSSYLTGKIKRRDFKSIKIFLEQDREVLYQRINGRVDQMILAGLEDEVASLREYWSLPSLQTVGYQEWIPYFLGSRTRDEVIRLVKRNSRRYAKRQLTWFRKSHVDYYLQVSEIQKIESWLKQQFS